MDIKQLLQKYIESNLEKEEKPKRSFKTSGFLNKIKSICEQRYSPLVYKFFCLQSHYRKQLVFSYEGLDVAKSAYDKLIKRINNLKVDDSVIDNDVYNKFTKQFKDALANDLNTALAITAVFDVLKADINNNTKIALIKDFDSVLEIGLKDEIGKVKVEEVQEIDAELKAYIEKMIEERKLAKAEKNYARADEIRNELTVKGIELIDTKEGTTYKLK